MCRVGPQIRIPPFLRAYIFEARDPRLAADVANAYAQTFIAANLQRRFAASAYARDFLSGQLIEVKARLDRQWADFATTKGGFELLKREDVLTRPSVMRYWLQRADNDGTAELARVSAFSSPAVVRLIPNARMRWVSTME